MSISVRSIKQIMKEASPATPISEDAAKLLKAHLEAEARSLAEQAGRIHEGENALRRQIGERPKQRLSGKHVRMAIDGKFSDSGGATNGQKSS